MALVILDASVLIALLDPADGLHHASRQAFEGVAGDELAIPASALAETLVIPARAGQLEKARASIRLLDLRVAPAEKSVAVEAAQLRGRHPRLRLPDALVLATGEVLEADLLLTGDQSWRPISKRVSLVTQTSSEWIRRGPPSKRAMEESWRGGNHRIAPGERSGASAAG